ncbi:MAG: hypothetical protein MUF75_04860 [Bacteroidia bacterium]|jgi:hypothetical protein|nr:hypothetical protein [Bacteroidia bacterium]
MQDDKPHRPHRVPPDQEEIARRVALREYLKVKKLQAFKSSNTYRFLNILNVACFFVYWELILCFFGPCHYREVEPEYMQIKFGNKTDARGFRFIKEINLVWYGGKIDKAIVEDYVRVVTDETMEIHAGRDFILQKDLKVRLGDETVNYRLAHSSPLLFLCAFLILATAIAYNFNFNQTPIVLQGISILNLCVIVAVCFI